MICIMLWQLQQPLIQQHQQQIPPQMQQQTQPPPQQQQLIQSTQQQQLLTQNVISSETGTILGKNFSSTANFVAKNPHPN